MKTLVLIPATVLLLTVTVCGIVAQENAVEVSKSDTNTSWVYPVSWPDLPAGTDLNLLAHRTSCIETLRSKTCSTNVIIPSEIASFEDVVKWYSAKIKHTELWESFAAFKRSNDQKPLRRGSAKPYPGNPSATITYACGPNYDQIKILHLGPDDQIVSVSLISTDSETSIDVVQQYPRLD